MADIIVDRTTYIKFGTDEPISTGIAEGSMLIDKILFTDDIIPGSFASSRFEIQIYGVGNVAGKNIKVYQVENGVQKDLFTGIVESAKLDNAGYYRQIVAYDVFYFLSRKNVADWFNSLFTGQTTEISNLQAFQSLITYLGLSPDQNTVIAANFNGSIYKDSIVQFEKIALRDMLKFLLESSALIPYINESGEVAVYRPALANSVDLVSKYDVNESIFEEYTVNPFQYVRILNVDNAVISSGTVSGVTSGLTYDIDYNPISLRWYKDLDIDYAAAAISQFISRSGFQAYKPCDIHMIVSDMSIKLGDLITTSKGVSYVSEIIYSGPMLVEQEIISRGSQAIEEVEEDYDPVYAYLDNKIGETADKLTSEFEQAIEDYEPSEEYTEKVRQFSDTIMNGMGLKIITRVDPETGAKILYYYAPDNNGAITNSKFVLKLSSAGFGWTDKWEGNADASSESHVDPVSGRTISTEWGQGIGSNGTSILKLLSVYQLEADQIKAGAITADKIRAGAITVSKSNLGQDVIDFIESQGGEDDGINVHATAGTLSENNYPLTTTEQVTELAEGDIVAITFPNGVDFSLNTSGSTYLYKPRTVSIGNNTYTLLNANGTTDWCNVKDSADYSGNVTVKYIARLLDSTLKLCELVEVENVIDDVMTTQSGEPSALKLTNALTNAQSGTVVKADVSNLQYGLAFSGTSPTATNFSSPYFSIDGSNFSTLLSKNHYSREKGIADAYTASELYYIGSTGGSGYVGNSSSSGSERVKVVTDITPTGFVVRDGAVLNVNFTYANTNSYPVLRINGTYYDLFYDDRSSGGGGSYGYLTPSCSKNWYANSTVEFEYSTSFASGYGAGFVARSVNPVGAYYFTPKTESEPTGVSSVNIILENLRTSSGTTLRAFELRFDPYSTAPMAIDQEARDAADRALIAAMAASTAVNELDSDVDSRISDAIAGITVEGAITTFYGTCGTSSGTAAKVVNVYKSDGSTLDDSFTLKKGAIINVSFTNANTATTPTLNVNSTGAKAIYVNNAQLHYGSSYTTNAYNWKANTVVQFMYDGSYWRMSQTSADLILGKWCATNDVTMINGGKIATGSIAADSIAANAITAVKLAASDAMLVKLLAYNATITGTLTFTTTNTEPTTNDLNTVAQALFELNYDQLPVQFRTLVAATAKFFKNVFNTKIKAYSPSDSSSVTALLTPGGLVVNTEGISESTIVADMVNGNHSYYGDGANIKGSLVVAGDLTVGGTINGGSGSSSQVIKSGSTTVELKASSGYTGNATVQFNSAFSSPPTVVVTAGSTGIIASYSSVGTSSFSIFVTDPFELGNQDVSVNWIAIGN